MQNVRLSSKQGLFEQPLSDSELANMLVTDSIHYRSKGKGLFCEVSLIKVGGRTVHYDLDMRVKKVNIETGYVEDKDSFLRRVDTAGQELENSDIQDRIKYEMNQIWNSIPSNNKFGLYLVGIKPEDFDSNPILVYGLAHEPKSEDKN